MGKAFVTDTGSAETSTSGLTSGIPSAAPCVTMPCVIKMSSGEAASTGANSSLVGVAAITVGGAVAVASIVLSETGLGGSSCNTGRNGVALEAKTDVTEVELPVAGNKTGVGIGEGISDFDGELLRCGPETNPSALPVVPASLAKPAPSSSPPVPIKTRKARKTSNTSKAHSSPMVIHRFKVMDGTVIYPPPQGNAHLNAHTCPSWAALLDRQFAKFFPRAIIVLTKIASPGGWRLRDKL